MRKAQEKLEKQREKREKEVRRSAKLPLSSDSVCWGVTSAIMHCIKFINITIRREMFCLFVFKERDIVHAGSHRTYPCQEQPCAVIYVYTVCFLQNASSKSNFNSKMENVKTFSKKEILAFLPLKSQKW